MERKTYRVEIDTGSEARFVAFPTVSVYDAGTATLAQIFDDDGITIKPNPFTGPSSGLVYFYAADGKYDIRFTDGTPDLGSTGYTLPNVLLDDTLSLSNTSGGGITSLNALTALSQTFAVGTAGTDFAVSSSGSTHTHNLPFASSTSHGKLSSASFAVFNAKIGTLNGRTEVTQALAIGSSGSSPNWVSTAGLHTLNLPTASASKSGILSSSDWILFNSKQASLSGGTSSQYLRGDMTFAALTTSAVPEGSNLYYSDARVRAAISATSPVVFSAGGVISIQVATTAQPGYLTAADWTTFNNKISSVTTDATGSDFSASTAAGAVTVHLPEASPTVTGGKVSNTTQSLSGSKTLNSEFITAAGRRRYVRVHAAPATVTVAQNLDDIIVVNKDTAGATTVTLPAAPLTGQTITIKDGKGDAASNNISISGNGKNIDGATPLTLSGAYDVRTLVYNGTEWNRIG